MEQRNWDAFCHLDSMENAKLGVRYYQQYLQPALYVWVHFTHTDEAALLGSYRQVLALIGDRFQYHQSDASRLLRIRDKAKSTARFPAFLADPNKKHLWLSMDDRAGPGQWPKGGKPGVTGGVGKASFTVWMHKYTPESYRQRTEETLLHGQQWGCTGQHVSYMLVRLPVEAFAKTADFLQWVLALPLLQSPALFSATAGYQMGKYGGYVKKEADEKLAAILTEHPGFETAHLGDILGHVYSEQHRQTLPMLARINWLNAVGESAFSLYPGGLPGLQRAAGQCPQLALHPLAHGQLVQAGSGPGIGGGGKAPEAYYEAARLLQPFLLHTFGRRHLPHRQWLLHFHANQALSYIGMPLPLNAEELFYIHSDGPREYVGTSYRYDNA